MMCDEVKMAVPDEVPYFQKNVCLLCGFSFIVIIKKDDGTKVKQKLFKWKLKLSVERVKLIENMVEINISSDSDAVRNECGVCSKCYQTVERLTKAEKEIKKHKKKWKETVLNISKTLSQPTAVTDRVTAAPTTQTAEKGIQCTPDCDTPVFGCEDKSEESKQPPYIPIAPGPSPQLSSTYIHVPAFVTFKCDSLKQPSGDNKSIMYPKSCTTFPHASKLPEPASVMTQENDQVSKTIDKASVHTESDDAELAFDMECEDVQDLDPDKEIKEEPISDDEACNEAICEHVSALSKVNPFLNTTDMSEEKEMDSQFETQEIKEEERKTLAEGFSFTVKNNTVVKEECGNYVEYEYAASILSTDGNSLKEAQQLTEAQTTFSKRLAKKRTIQADVKERVIPHVRPYRNYSDDELNQALAQIKEKHISVSRAARLFGIPQSTLQLKFRLQTCKLNTDSEIQLPPKPLELLPIKEEAKLLEYLSLMHRLGYHIPKKNIIRLAKMLERNNVSPSLDLLQCPLTAKAWIGNFIKKNPVLSHYLSLTYTVTSENVRYYFTELGEIIEKHHLLDCPELIYKIDDIGLGINNNPFPKFHSAHLQVLRDTFNRSEKSPSPLVTLVGCGNALGTALPPYFVINGNTNKLSHEFCDRGPPGTQRILKNEASEGGPSILRAYIEGHFTKYAQMGDAKRGVLLLYNGNASLLSIDDIEWARQQQIYLYVLPPHGCSKIKPVDHFEPFDVGLFSHFNFYVEEESRSFTGGYAHKAIEINDVSYIAGKAYHRCLSWENLSRSFKKCGIYPFHPRTYISALNSSIQSELTDFEVAPIQSQGSKKVIIPRVWTESDFEKEFIKKDR